MSQQFRCNNPGRKNAAKKAKVLNGMDYLEVASGDQKTIHVYFLFNLPGQPNSIPSGPVSPLTRDNILIEGGVRVQHIKVESVSTTNQILQIRVNEAGDFSTYTLKLVVSPTNPSTPPGFDPQLSSIDFSFKVACPSEFDCKTETECPPSAVIDPDINYLAKDYGSFRRLMLDRLSVIQPNWHERNPADIQMMLVELLAYVGDYLSYYQDAVGTEAYLGTSRKRSSVKRHVRLLDYFLHEGNNARTWVVVNVKPGGNADAQTLPASTPVIMGEQGNPLLSTHPIPTSF